MVSFARHWAAPKWLLLLLMTASLANLNPAAAQEPPAIGITSPAQGATVTAPDVTTEVAVTEFTLVPPTGNDQNAGEGHIIYYLDVEPVFVPGQPAIPADPGAVYVASDQLTHTFEDVAPGSHDVTVLLVHDDHTPALPPAIDQVAFTVAAPSETPEPQPGPRVTEEARSVDVEDATPTPTPLATPTAAVLPAAELPAAGDPPADSAGGPGAWLFTGIAAGVLSVAGGAAVVAMRRGRR